MSNATRRVNLRLQDEMLETRRFLITADTERVIVHPRCYSSKRIVIERIHTVVLTKSILYCIRVQTLPNRRGSILYRIKPGRITLVLQQTVSLLGHTIIRKCLTDPSGTDKTRQERISRITGHRSLDGCSEMSRHLLL